MSAVERKYLLCAGPITCCMCDLIVTLWGQSSGYWAGDYGDVTEGNPIPRWLLQQHPGALVIAIIVWIATFSGAILWLSDRPANIIAGSVVLGHAFAVCTWWVNDGIPGILGIVCLLLFVRCYAHLFEQPQNAVVQRAD